MKRPGEKGPEQERGRRPLLWGGIAAAALLTCAVALFRGLGPETPPRQNWAALSDGFFVAGVLVGGVGLLVLIGTTGFFDMLSYALQGLWFRLAPFLHPKGQQPFYDYKLAREKRRGQPRYTLITIGAACVALGGLCLALYYAV